MHSSYSSRAQPGTTTTSFLLITFYLLLTTDYLQLPTHYVRHNYHILLTVACMSDLRADFALPSCLVRVRSRRPS